jgi:hypothetical protein
MGIGIKSQAFLRMHSVISAGARDDKAKQAAAECRRRKASLRQQIDESSSQRQAANSAREREDEKLNELKSLTVSPRAIRFKQEIRPFNVAQAITAQGVSIRLNSVGCNITAWSKK